MPYRRRRYTRRRSRGRPQWYNRRYSAKDLAKRALQQAWRLRGLVNSEMLKHDIGGSTNVNATTSIPLKNLVAIPQGDTDITRTGNSIFARALHGTVVCEKHASATFTYVRVMLLLDTQSISDTDPVISDVLESNWQSHLNSDTVGRFNVLAGKTIVLDANRPSMTMKINKPMRHHVRYNGPASTDVQRGAMYLLLLSSETVNLPTVRYNLRLSYHDN